MVHRLAGDYVKEKVMYSPDFWGEITCKSRKNELAPLVISTYGAD